MSSVEAITKATSQEISELREQAKDLGGTTAFTATQVAMLQKELGKLGFTSKEILEGAGGILDLAAATGEDLAKSAEVAGATVRIFGLEAKVSGLRIRVGKPGWFEDGNGLPQRVSDLVEDISSQGKTVMLVEVEGRLAGLLAVADEEKQGAREAVTELRGMGITPIMITGDNQGAARAIAGKVGIDRVEASVLPERKEEIVRQAHEQGKIVAMVGDGINDAPALARADVGVAIGSGTDVAMEASDLTLVGGELSGVSRAIKLAKATMRTIRQNLFWAFFYNAALVPLAAGAFHTVSWMPVVIRDLHPAMAAGAMAVSSVTVVMNSLRLGRRQI